MKTTKTSKAGPLALVLALAALPALAGAAEPAAAPKPFPHKQHVGEQEMPCKSCHDLKAETPVPALKTKGCGKCHDDGPPEYVKPGAAKLKVALPHAAHAAKVECTECHLDVVEDRHADTDPLVAPGSCAKCHEEKKVKLAMGNCEKCHGTNVKHEEPASHDGTWRVKHGQDSKWRVYGEHGKTCTDCHKTATCKSCHDEELPRDHTGLWRVRTHGLAAEWDRDRCKTCHETGTCVSCHRESRPLNHTGAWKQTHGLTAGGRTNETCNVCHQAGECASCHSGR